MVELDLCAQGSDYLLSEFRAGSEKLAKFNVEETHVTEICRKSDFGLDLISFIIAVILIFLFGHFSLLIVYLQFLLILIEIMICLFILSLLHCFYVELTQIIFLSNESILYLSLRVVG